METDTCQWLFADDYGRGLSGKRRLINVIVDPQYVMEPFVMASLYIDVVHIPEAKGCEQLRRMLTGHAEHLGRTLCVCGGLIHGFAAATPTRGRLSANADHHGLIPAVATLSDPLAGVSARWKPWWICASS